MNTRGVRLAARFAYPPNSLSLCGPERQSDLLHSVKTGAVTAGTAHILSEFSTMFPYLRLIAASNGIDDPLHPSVVEGYWIGNRLLNRVPVRDLGTLLTDGIGIKKRITKAHMRILADSLECGALPHHNYHVLNVYARTGHDTSAHTVQTMNACIINCGNVINILSTSLTVRTKPLVFDGRTLCFGKPATLTVRMEAGETGSFPGVKQGDTISYHWGHMCTVLTRNQAHTLMRHTLFALRLANDCVKKDHAGSLAAFGYENSIHSG